MNKNKRVILLSERGWRGIREFSIFLARNTLDVFVLIKGFPEKEIRSMITLYPGIHNIFIPKKIYRIWVFIYLLINLIFYKIYLFSSKRNKQCFVNFLRLRPFFVYEKNNGYGIRDSQEKEIKPEIILQKIYL